MKILMVSTEYPPMKGGVGRYTANLVKALRKKAQVDVVCSSEGSGEFSGISPANENNSEVLLKIARESKADVVHVQFEPGLYGLVLDPGNPSRSRTFIDPFYEKCEIPIVTTFHSAYTFRQWMAQGMAIKRAGRTGRLGIPARVVVKTWNCLVNYRAFHDINREKLRQSAAGICFSGYMARRVGGGRIIYHGAEPAAPLPSKLEVRRRFSSLPADKRIAVAVGFGTATKGWDILDRIEPPEGWVLATNSSKGHYNRETGADIGKNRGGGRNNIVDLQRGFLSEEELSWLLFACDAVLLPYKITGGSGVMFDALAHGLPFVASDLDFFREFSSIGLGISAKRDPESFAAAIREIGENYARYSEAVEGFRQRLKWDFVADQHIQLYSKAMARKERSDASAA